MKFMKKNKNIQTILESLYNYKSFYLNYLAQE